MWTQDYWAKRLDFRGHTNPAKNVTIFFATTKWRLSGEHEIFHKASVSCQAPLSGRKQPLKQTRKQTKICYVWVSPPHTLYLVPSPKWSGPYPTVRFTVVFFSVTLRILPRLDNSASQIYRQCDLCASHFARIQIS